MKNNRITCAIAAWIVAALALPGGGATLPHIFGHNMVLQRGQRVPVWGKGAPGEKVSVSFAGQSVSTTTGADGRWRVRWKVTV